MKKIRLVALDIDGTLLDDQKRLPPENRDALQEVARRGIRVAIASGRMIPRIEPIEDLLGIDCVLIAYNGGTVVGPRREGRPRIAHRPVPADVAEYFIHYSRETGQLLNFYHEDRLYAEGGPRRQPLIDLYSSRTGAEFTIEEDLRRFIGVRPTKLILLAEPEDVDRLRLEFQARFGSRAFFTKSEAEYLEILAPGVDKGSALTDTARYYGLEVEETMAMGDAENDIELLHAAGWGVAMANASPHVRAAANAVTERSNNEGGVAEGLRRWVLDGASG